MNSASVAIHQPDATIEDLIDVVEGNRSVRCRRSTLSADVNSVYVPAIFVLNKIDAISIEELDLLYKVRSTSMFHSRTS